MMINSGCDSENPMFLTNTLFWDMYNKRASTILTEYPLILMLFVTIDPWPLVVGPLWPRFQWICVNSWPYVRGSTVETFWRRSVNL